jgi:mRNA-degrading endonuclease RelE of RelBE toxin-antitoxin system
LHAVARFATTGQGNVVRLQGVTRQWRLRVGDWRVRFTMDAAMTTLIVLMVRHRSDVYRD